MWSRWWLRLPLRCHHRSLRWIPGLELTPGACVKPAPAMACTGPALGHKKDLRRRLKRTLLRVRAVPALGFGLMAKQGNRGFEILQRFERLVDTGETQIGNLVKALQRLQDRQPDFVGFDFGGTGSPDRLLDFLGEQREVVFRDRAALAGLADAVNDLAATEGLADARALDDGQAGGFHGGEPAAAFGTLPAAPDGGAVVGNPAVHHARVRVSAERAIHVGSSRVASLSGAQRASGT